MCPSRARKLFKQIKADYEYNPDIFREEDQTTALAKWAIRRYLSEDEQITFKLYAELQSLTETARALGVPRSSVHDKVVRCRKIIKTVMKIYGYEDHH